MGERAKMACRTPVGSVRVLSGHQLRAGCPAVGSTNTRIMPPLSSMTAGLLREMCSIGAYLRKTPTGGPVPWLLVRDEEPARLTPSGRDSA